MAKASINFAKASSGGLKHNDRTEEKEPEYLLPVEHRLKNEVNVSAKIADEKIKDLYSKAKENYQDKFGQKLQAKSYTWEAVINLNKEHTLEDVERLTKEIEKETGFTSVQIAIHRDEGRIERGTPIYNLHAHVTFFTLDQNTGQQLYRKSITPKQKEQQPNLKPMNRERLSKLQDITAKALGMERGKKGSKAQRLDHKQYKAVKQAELAKVKDLKEEIKELRAELKAQGAGREDYAKLEALNKELKEQVKAKDLTIDELKRSVNTWRHKATNWEEAKTYQDLYEEIKEEKIALEAKISDFKTLDVQTDLKTDKNDLKAISEVLKDTNQVGDYDKVLLLESLESLEQSDPSKDFSKMVREKGEHKKPSMLNKRHTVTFEMHDLKEFLQKLEDAQKLKEKVLKSAKELLNKFEKPLNAVKSFVHKHFTTPKAKERMRERQKEKAIEREQSKDQGMER